MESIIPSLDVHVLLATWRYMHWKKNPLNQIRTKSGIWHPTICRHHHTYMLFLFVLVLPYNSSRNSNSMCRCPIPVGSTYPECRGTGRHALNINGRGAYFSNPVHPELSRRIPPPTPRKKPIYQQYPNKTHRKA